MTWAAERNPVFFSARVPRAGWSPAEVRFPRTRELRSGSVGWGRGLIPKTMPFGASCLWFWWRNVRRRGGGHRKPLKIQPAGLVKAKQNNYYPPEKRAVPRAPSKPRRSLQMKAPLFSSSLLTPRLGSALRLLNEQTFDCCARNNSRTPSQPPGNRRLRLR